MRSERLQLVGRVVSMVVLVATVVGIVYAFLEARRQARVTPASQRERQMAPELVSRIIGYRNVRMRNGREGVRILADEELAFSDGHHELVRADVTVMGNPVTGTGGTKTTRIVAHHAAFYPAQSLLTFTDRVVVTTSDGLVVTTEVLQFDQETRVASTPVAIQFRQGELEGHAVGARILAESRQVELLADVWVASRERSGQGALPEEPSVDTSPRGPFRLEIRSQRAFYDEQSWQLRFEGQVSLLQGEQTAQSASLLGQMDGQSRRLKRVELRGGVKLTTLPSAGTNQLTARDIDIELDGQERVTQALARGQVAAVATSEGQLRQMEADQLTLQYALVGERSLPRTMTATGTVRLRLEVPEKSTGMVEPTPSTPSPALAQRTLEAKQVDLLFQPDGETLQQASARGEPLLTITPGVVTQTAERTRLRADQMQLEFAPTGNRLRRFLAEGRALATSDPLFQGSPRPRRTLAAQRLTGRFEEGTQQLAETIAEGAVRLTEEDRLAIADRATYSTRDDQILMRGRPRLSDPTIQAQADEIDLHLGAEETVLRGRVRTTYFNRQATGGTLAFRQRQAPVSVAADRATIRHRTGVAQYVGDARAWQEDEFLRADRLELDRTQQSLLADGRAQSAYYQLEREVAPGRRERLPLFASADRIRYQDDQRRTFYDGAVRLRQGGDSLEAASAEALLDADHRLIQITARSQVVMTQPDRLARGEQIVYRPQEETAILTGTPAVLEDRSRQVLTQSEKLTLDMRGATIQASPDADRRKRVRTSHRIP
jgi:LPS export ABC transporter protein LptC